MSQPSEVLEFWFGKPGDPEYGQPRKEWFLQNAEFDEQIRTRFGADLARAAAGELEEWKLQPESCLAYIILLDQFSRNLFREEDGRAFANDHRALAAAKYAIDQGFDQQVLPVQRWFFYLPFEHSENREDQQRSLELWHALPDDSPGKEGVVDYAIRHKRVIDRFGRFPHRSASLGRPSTPEELEFLQSPEAPF